MLFTEPAHRKTKKRRFKNYQEITSDNDAKVFEQSPKRLPEIEPNSITHPLKHRSNQSYAKIVSKRNPLGGSAC